MEGRKKVSSTQIDQEELSEEETFSRDWDEVKCKPSGYLVESTPAEG